MNPERELRHFQILAKIYFRVGECNVCMEDCTIFLDETEEDLFEAEVKDELPFEPSCIQTDIREAMRENKIEGRLYHQIDYNVAKTVAVI